MSIKKYVTWSYPGHKRAQFFEFFAELLKYETPADKVKALREYASIDGAHNYAMRAAVECLTHPGVVWDLPEGAPPYRAGSPHPDKSPYSFLTKAKKLSYFLNGSSGKIGNTTKREHVFIQTLEGLAQGEAAFLIAVKDRDFATLGVTHELLLEAFPQWVVPKNAPAASSKSTGEAPKEAQTTTSATTKPRVGGRFVKKSPAA